MLRPYNPNMITYDEIIDGWRTKVKGFTLRDAIRLLKRLGRFEKDEVLICCRGIYTIQVCDLWKYYSNDFARCGDIQPVYFTGGPTGEVRFKGTLLTLVIDRILAVCLEKGSTYVGDLVSNIQNSTQTA